MKMNWHKSCVVWASLNFQNWSWGEDLGLKWLGKGQATKYLGFQVGFEVPQQEKDVKVIQQVRGKHSQQGGNKFPCQVALGFI